MLSVTYSLLIDKQKSGLRFWFKTIADYILFSIIFFSTDIFNRPGEAGAVLQPRN